MTMRPTKLKTNYSGIDSIHDLRMEQRRLKMQLKSQELELRGRVKQVPGELFYAGANALIPGFLSGKITSSVLNTGRHLVNTLFSKNGKSEGSKSKLFSEAGKAGLFSALRFAFKMFITKK
jgi:hypothetical protein